MYKNYKLVTFILNVNGGESETVEHLQKEVEGKYVDLTESEAILKMFDKVSKIGGNPSTKNIKCMLFNPNGDLIKIEEVIKEVAE